ncbi:MAG: hypothetical protein M0Q13_09945 [Methanothrix sp.]|jgi:hypothetical protein|nr:hypothetical protein [Methanothrix sp.]
MASSKQESLGHCIIKAEKWNRTTEIDIRRAFTAFQLMIILKENHHRFLIIEHDPMLYEDATEMVEIRRSASPTDLKSGL